MRATKPPRSIDEMRSQYDFSNGVRGKYAAPARSSNVVVLEPDVARAFKTSRAVNAALRLHLLQRKPARKAPSPPPRSTPRRPRAR
ncbi:MAG: hypothetical protein JWM82_1102 [Myxococcales bacterium]|nr:hypothetical protein [Myxococcales bacterium]